MNDLVPVPLTAGDEPQLESVYTTAWRAAFGHLLTPELVSDSELADKAARLCAHEVVLVLKQQHQLVGFAAGNATTGMLDALYVDPAAWGSGAAGALLHEAADALAQHGRRPWLLAWTGNMRALTFYDRHGWMSDGPGTAREVAGIRFDYHRLTAPR